MKHLIALAALLAAGAAAPAAAQTTTTKASFGCDARAPNLCIFRIYYARGSREVFLPAGMKAQIPEVRIGSDTYCAALNKKPLPSCNRKVISSKYNS
jgi:hypothetical protein